MTIGTVYLLHLDPPFKHAAHYIGWTELTVGERMQRHHTHRGAALLRAQRKAGGSWRVARTWDDAERGLEMRLKAMGGARRICPICRNLAQESRTVALSPAHAAAYG